MIKGPLDIFMNPGLLEDLSHRQYHRSDDFYSLKVMYVVSFKIAMWESTSFHSMIGTSAYAEAKWIFQGLKEDHVADAPPRKAYTYYHEKRDGTLRKATINPTDGKVESDTESPDIQGLAEIDEIGCIYNVCNEYPAVEEEIKKLKLPEGAYVTNDPWTFGTDDPEANHYSLPAPFAPIFNVDTSELIEVQRLPLGVDAKLNTDTQPWDPVKPVEYSTSLLGDAYFRKNLKPLQIVQPQGLSFCINGRHITWQKWSFHKGWTVHERPVLNNVFYDGRSLFDRAFDLGDSGFGITSNTLTLGCDCLSHIAYLDGVRTTGAGEPVVIKDVICMHEMDNGIGWKHTNFRNNKASMVRSRQLVIRCTITVMNYEYILAFVLDQSANLHIEVKATGIVSTMPIRQNTYSPWGTVVAPGVLAANHQDHSRSTLVEHQVAPCSCGK
ncbi:uncharacterized protein ASPGLDRAFT_34040 [Aspergillus glaucus CBS 516.65]|uniref:Amine oxidase n=1 Tax=Aspergillus glaucus CBS 516.65 TaxID=1160497 RepID=A0A1L9VQH0_ASPGL|nr:hypothetical protein ASPGLDRAFT_34040 [Aspergillus glaucus CBS 516.65]OJJ86142.1 hypothetical protein ASPGLDRAFT_34040 [Aspergillus glaucus CBS 516.65]